MDNYGGADERLIRVLDVEEGSPAAVAGLMKEKDFMLGTTTQNFNSSTILAAVLEENADQVIEIYVYNTDSDMVRVVALVPTISWGGAGLLGAEVGTGYLHRLPTSCRSTIGQSVERKVRWTSDDSGGVHARNSGLVEMEPHLEMEVDTDEPLTGRTRQPHELGRSEIPLAITKNSADTSSVTIDQGTFDKESGGTVSEHHTLVGLDDNAAAIFSGPPPTETKSIGEMPPPPKMTYSS